MRLSLHALGRWRERHPDLDHTQELLTARMVSKRLLRILRDPNYSGVPGRREPQVIRYMVTSNQVILVVTPDDTVMTVLDMAEAKQWKKIRRQTLIKVRRMGTL